MSDDLEHFKKRDKILYNHVIDIILSFNEDKKKSKCCLFWAKLIVSDNIRASNIRNCKIGFALGFVCSVAAVAGLCLSQNYTDNVSKIGMSLVLVALLAVFIATSICSFVAMKNAQASNQKVTNHSEDKTEDQKSNDRNDEYNARIRLTALSLHHAELEPLENPRTVLDTQSTRTDSLGNQPKASHP